MSSSNCCFLSCIQVSQATGRVVWYSCFFKNFPVCCDSNSQRLFSFHSNEAQIDIFLEFSCFLYGAKNVGNLVPLPLWIPACTYGSSQFTYCWSLPWRILSITLLACEMSTIVQQFEHSLALPSFGIVMTADLFQSCGHYCFPNMLACWVQHFNSIIS